MKQEGGIRVKGIAPYLFILPILIGVSLFGFYCLAYVLKLSFTETNLFSSEFVGLENYREVLLEKKWFITSLLHTLYYGVCVVPMSLAFGLGLALLVSKTVRFGVFFRFTYLLPWVSSGIIIALIFRYIFNPEWGIVNWVLEYFRINKIMWTEDTSTVIPVVAFMRSWQTMGFGMIIFLGAIKDIPLQLSEAADLEGASCLQKFWFVTLPLLKPAVSFYLVIVLIQAFQTFDIIYAFLEGSREAIFWSLFSQPILVCSYFTYSMAFKMFFFGKASAMAVIMFLVVLAIILVQRRFLGQRSCLQ